jgi:predicted transport protein
MPKAPSDMRAAIIRNLLDKTGRSIGQWADLMRSKAPAGSRKERIAWLQREHALGHTQAAMIVDWVDRPEVFEEADPAALVESMVKGKEPIRPIFTRLTLEIEELGDDVKVEPRQTYVAFSRVRQFAVLQPSTATRLDVGLVLPAAEETPRLRPAGSFGSGRISHRVSLAHEDEIDAELTGWLRDAYAFALPPPSR